MKVGTSQITVLILSWFRQGRNKWFRDALDFSFPNNLGLYHLYQIENPETRIDTPKFSTEEVVPSPPDALCTILRQICYDERGIRKTVSETGGSFYEVFICYIS